VMSTLAIVNNRVLTVFEENVVSTEGMLQEHWRG
jgi:hypothetical protein